MLILLIILFIWTIFMGVYVIKPLLLPENDPSIKVNELSVIIDNEAFRIDMPIAQDFSHNYPLLLQCIRNQQNPRLMRLITDKIGRRHAFELCFILVHYYYGGLPFTCIYSINGINDTVPYPPKPLFKTIPSDPNQHITKAIVTVKQRGSSATSNVTEALSSIYGPRCDFHLSSGAGFQLRKRVLRVLLDREIAFLKRSVIVDVAERDMPVFQRHRDAYLTCRLFLHVQGRPMPVVVRLE